MVQKRLDEWNSLYPDEQVTLVELSAEADQQRQSLINNAQTQSDAYDVMSLDVVWISEFAANQWVLQLPEADLKSDDVIDAVWDAGVYRDKLFAVPHATDSSIMYYRKDFLAEAGVEVPKTWDDVKKAIDAVRAVSGHEEIGGFGGQFAKYEGLTCCASEFIHTAGGSFYDDAGTVTVNSSESVQGLQNLMDGFKDGYIPGQSREWKEEDGRNAFEMGNLLFYRQWPYQYANNLANLGADKIRRRRSAVHRRQGLRAHARWALLRHLPQLQVQGDRPEVRPVVHQCRVPEVRPGHPDPGTHSRLPLRGRRDAQEVPLPDDPARVPRSRQGPSEGRQLRGRDRGDPGRHLPHARPVDDRPGCHHRSGGEPERHPVLNVRCLGDAAPAGR